MPYDVLEKKIKTLSPEYYSELEDFVDFLCTKSEKTKTTSEKKLEAFNEIFGMITHEQAEEMRSNCGLHFREI